jgi:hypothetical protein
MASRADAVEDEEDDVEDAPLDELEPPWHYQRTSEKEEVLFDRRIEVGELHNVTVDSIAADLIRLDKDILREEGGVTEDLNNIIRDAFVPGGNSFKPPKTPKPKRYLEMERRMARTLNEEWCGDPTLILSEDDDWIMPPNPVGAGRKEMVKKLKKLRAACWDLPPEEGRMLDELADSMRRTDELDKKVRSVLAMRQEA